MSTTTSKQSTNTTRLAALSHALSDPKFADEVLDRGIQNALAFLR